MCTHCNHKLGFIYDQSIMISLDENNNGSEVYSYENNSYTFCKNHNYHACNWLVNTKKDEEFCEACSLNRNIPNLSAASNLEKWKELELAKHRLVYQLSQLKLPVVSKFKDAKSGLFFDFVKEGTLHKNSKKKVMTGQANDVVTIILKEGDSVHLEQIRKQLNEPYRTLIGHFRHEIGHYYWDLLIRSNPNSLYDFKLLFGDHDLNYSKSLQNYYKNGPAPNWSEFHISKYASAHPWEDWAETWAHYLHIMDTVETAYYFQLSASPIFSNEGKMNFSITYDPYVEQDFDLILKDSLSLFYMLNSTTRSMGIIDPYPFVTPAKVIDKLKFIHKLVSESKK